MIDRAPRLGGSRKGGPYRRRLIALTVVAAALALVVAALTTPPVKSWLHVAGRRPLSGRDLGEPGWPASFDLRDTSGRERTPADLRGRVALVTFGYTHCPDSCPTTLARLAEVRRLLGDEAQSLQVVFITIDPERDSAALLGGYVGAFDPSFWGLRGNAPQTEAAARAFHAEFQVSREGAEVRVEHTVDVYLVDPRGRIREILPPYVKARQLAEDVLAEIASG